MSEAVRLIGRGDLGAEQAGPPGSLAASSAAKEEGALYRAPSLRLPVALRLGVAEFALGRLEHAGAVLVLALVAADGLDSCVVALGEHGADFVHA